MLLLQFTVGDDIVQHLSTVDVLEDHVVMMGQDHDLVETDNVGVVQHHHNGRLANGSCLPVVLLFLLCGGHVWIRLHTRNDLDRDLSCISSILTIVVVVVDRHWNEKGGGEL